MKYIHSLLALSFALVFLSCGTEYEGNVGGASDPTYCVAPESVSDTDEGITSPLFLSNVDKAAYTSGCEIYLVKCATCHMLDGDTISESLDLNNPVDGATIDSVCATCEAHSWLSDKISTSMPPERGESKFLTIEDSAKVATYLRAKFYSDITPSNDTEPANLPESMRPDEDLENVEGFALYKSKSCEACHGDEGQGTGLFNKPMTFYTTDRNTLISKLKNGGSDPVYTESNDTEMPQGQTLTDVEYGQIADYMEEAFDYITWP